MCRIVPVSDHVANKVQRGINREPGDHWFYQGKSGKVLVGGTVFRDYQVTWLLSHDHQLPKRLSNVCGVERCCNPAHWRDATVFDADRLPISNAPKPSDLDAAKNEVKYHKHGAYFYAACNGQQKYLGKDQGEAIKRWERERPFFIQGIPIPQSVNGKMRMGELCSRFMLATQHKLRANKITRQHANNVKDSLERMLQYFGEDMLVSTMQPIHFTEAAEHILKHRGRGALDNEVRHWRMPFNWAFRENLLLRVPAFGDVFREESDKDRKKRLARESKAGKLAPKTFEAHEILAMLEHADTIQRAWLLLGINCAFGLHDISWLLADEICEYDDGQFWLDTLRLKQGEARRSHVWDETFEAVNAAFKLRADARHPELDDRVFLTVGGCEMTRSKTKSFYTPFDALMREAGCKVGDRGFYALRRTFRTVGDSTRDTSACRLAMGQNYKQGIDKHYLHGIDDERLLEVSDTVKRWLFESPKRRTNRRKLSRV